MQCILARNSSFCKKANKKLNALARIANYMDLEKRMSLMKAFITSQLNCFSLIWMFGRRSLTNQTNKLLEQALRIVYQSSNFSFNELLELGNFALRHHRNP